MKTFLIIAAILFCGCGPKYNNKNLKACSDACKNSGAIMKSFDTYSGCTCGQYEVSK